MRGDCGFGAGSFMKLLEARRQGDLFKSQLSKNVKRHIERVFWDAGWTDAGQGWESKDGKLRLAGWGPPRRVVVWRRPLQNAMLSAQEKDGQGLLDFVEADRQAGKRTTGDEYAELVTNLDHEILGLGQLYRDQADADQPAGRRTPRSGGLERNERCSAAAQNAFDELKNPWG